MALDRLQYGGPATSVQYRSDKRDGPTAGTETVGAPVDGAIIVAEPVSLPLREARSRWAELLRRIV